MMKKIFLPQLSFLLLALISFNSLFSQNSLLINFGSNSCTDPNQRNFSLINNPLLASPSLLADCSVNNQVPSIYSVFIAYNPKNNKVYLADNRSGTETKIWVLDVGLPANLQCPASIPVTPTYSYSYISNNFEFDNNGDLWSFSNYNPVSGLCDMDKFDVNTGNIINTRKLQFPLDNLTNTVASGDLCILPNGRMFAAFGTSPCKLYEVFNYSSTTATASASFLGNLPKVCYGIAFLNGKLEISGSDFGGGCYYFEYDIATGVFGAEKPFQMGLLPIDNTSITPAIGTTKRLLNSTIVDATTADLVYEVYAENMGNAVLNNVNLSDNLLATFGAGNVFNVQTSFVPGSNGAGLTLNPAYNGTTVTNLLNPGQNLPNRILTNKDYYFKVQISCRVTSLVPGTTYLNTAISSGNIGNIVNVSDSSNNGDSTRVDPNKNGNARELGENVPTPFSIGTVPVRFISITASLVNSTAAMVKWEVATPTVNAASFEVQFSRDGINWNGIAPVAIRLATQGKYQYNHQGVPKGRLYYRIKQVDNDGSFVYSKVVLLLNKTSNGSFVIFPNPANDVVHVSAPSSLSGSTMLQLFDATGRKVWSTTMVAATQLINTALLPNGVYMLQILNEQQITTNKILVKH